MQALCDNKTYSEVKGGPRFLLVKQRESILIFLRTSKPEFLLQAPVMWTPKAFHVRKIPA